MANGLEIKYTGVTFDSVRSALCAMYFLYDGMPKEEWRESLKYVLPEQHNFQNPIIPGGQDTWIQFWINEDDRWTQDYNERSSNEAVKVAHITVRFLGRRAEVWAKAFHHITQRRGVTGYFLEYCNGELLEYVGPIVPMNVDYFGVGNTTIAHDISFKIAYREALELDREPLEFISLPGGEISGA